MARKAQAQPQEWISTKEAAAILTKNSGHEVKTDYVRALGNNGKVEVKKLDGRTKVYLKSDIESYQVKERGDGSIRVAAGHPRRIRPDVSEQVG